MTTSITPIRRTPLLRLIMVALPALAALATVRMFLVAPTVPQDGPGGDFDVQRAIEDLRVITAASRVPASEGYAAAQAHLRAQLEALGLETQIQEGISVREQPGGVSLARASNLIARLPGQDSTGAVVLAGHLDSVHTTGAASDCGGCSAAVVEAARALVDRPRPRYDIIFLIEDGEETTRSGATIFVRDHPWARDVRVALNLESMGTRGASQLYVTGEDNGWLIGRAMQSMPAPVAYSFVNDLVWGTGTGGSDLDQLLEVADAGLGFAYLEGTPAYHTPLDSVQQLDPRALRHQGASILALARQLGDERLDGAITSGDATYFTLPGHHVLRNSRGVGLALALAAVLAVLAATVVVQRRGGLPFGGLLAGFGVVVLLTLLATFGAAAIWQALRWLDPRLQVFLIGVSYNRGWFTVAAVLLAAGLTMAGLALTGRRLRPAESSAAAVWIAAALGLWMALRLPGTSPHLALPALGGALLLMLCHRPQGRDLTLVRATLAGIAAAVVILLIAPLVHFLGIFSGRAEVLMGLPLIAALPALPSAFAIVLLMPLVDVVQGGRRGLVGGGLIAAAIGVGALAMFTGGFDAERPKPNMVAYRLDADAGHAEWVSGGAAVLGSRRSILGDWTRQFLGDTPRETLYSPWGAAAEDIVPAYAADAPVAPVARAEVEVLADEALAGGGRRLQLRFRSPGSAPAAVVALSTSGKLVGATVAEVELQTLTEAVPRRDLTLSVHGGSLEGLDLTVDLRGQTPLQVDIEEQHHSLPSVDGLTPRPRPPDMMASPTFVTDATLVRQRITLP